MIAVVGFAAGCLYGLWGATLWGAAHAPGPRGDAAVVAMILMPIAIGLMPGAPSPLPFALARQEGWIDTGAETAGLAVTLVAVSLASVLTLRRVGYVRLVEQWLTREGARRE